jgi:ryanodine receptor 2
MYTPKTIDTTGVHLSTNLEQLVERLAENTHDHWASQRIKDGWKHGLQRNDTAKEHPCLVAYQDLPESEKEYDRKTSMETLKAITSLGYRITLAAHETILAEHRLVVDAQRKKGVA